MLLPGRRDGRRSREGGDRREGPEEVRAAVARMREDGAQVLVAVEPFSVDDPLGELAVAGEAAAQGLPVTTTHEITQLYGLAKRARTAALNPIVAALSPSGPLLFVLVFAVLVPLCLYRGPFNVYGLGAGVAGVLVSGGIYPTPAVLRLMASYGQVLGVSDPTSTQTVWSAQYAGVRPERAMASTLPCTWGVAIGGLLLTAFLFLR